MNISFTSQHLFSICTVMEEFKTLQTEQLLDMLARHTEDYTRMFADGASHEDFIKCERVITFLQTEINYRRSSLSSNSINFSSDISE